MGMFGQNEQRNEAGSQTIIGSSVKVEGKFEGNGNVVIEGSVVGSVHTAHDLQVVEGAVVHADLDAKNVTISGEVHGSIKARETLELSPSARVYGDVEGKTISVGAGAILNGKCTMQATPSTEPVTDEIPSKERNRQNGKAGRPVEVV